MLISEESDENSSEDANTKALVPQGESITKSIKSLLETKLESLPSSDIKPSSANQAPPSSLGVHLQSNSTKASRRESTGSSRKTLHRILSENGLNASGSNLSFRPSSLNATWEPVTVNIIRKGKKPEKRGLLEDAAAEEDAEEGKDTVAPLLVSNKSSTGGRKNLFQRAASLKRFGLKSKETDGGTETDASSSSTQDAHNNKNLRGFFQKAASMRIVRQNRWDGFDEMSSNASDEFSMHSTSHNSHNSGSKSQEQQQRPGVEALSSLGQSLRRLNELGAKDNEQASTNNHGSSSRFGDSWSNDAEYSIASPTLWRENSEEMKPGLQFAPSTVATLLTEKMAQQAQIQQQQQPAVETKSEEPASIEDKPLAKTVSDADETKPKAPAESPKTGESPEVINGKASPEGPKVIKRTKAKGTKTTKKKKTSTKKNGGGNSSDDNDDDLLLSGHSKKSNKSTTGRKTRKGTKKKKQVTDNIQNSNSHENDQEEETKVVTAVSKEAQDTQSNDEDSDIQSVTSASRDSYFDDDDENLEKQQSFSTTSQRSDKPQSSSQRSDKPRSFSRSHHSTARTKSPKKQSLASPTSPKRLKPPPKADGSLSPSSLLVKKAAVETNTDTNHHSEEDLSDHESRASRRRTRRSELQQASSLFIKPAGKARRRRSLGGSVAKITGEKGKGYISSFLGSSSRNLGSVDNGDS